MIRNNLRVRNEFSLAPAYNQHIAAGQKVITAKTGREHERIYGLGTPSDLEFFKTTNGFNRPR